MQIDKVLCTTDFSEESDRAIYYAAQLCQQLGAKLHVLHVVPLPVPVPRLTAHDDVLRDLWQSTELEMQRLCDRWQDRGVQLETHIVAGRPAQAIVQESARMEMDLIVIGAHGWTGFSQLLVGSVTERVVRTSTVPVLTVRTRGADAERLTPA